MFRRYRRFVIRTAWATPLLLLAACQGLIHRGTDGCGPDEACAPVVPLHEPKVCKDPTLMSLAHDLDHLEKHIDWYGSVVAKSPDVWGQARLTQYREEFEKEMAKELTEFDARLNGSVSRADSSLFTFSQAISVAAAGKPGTPATPRSPLESSLSLSPGAVAAKLNDAGTVTQLVADRGLNITATQTVPQAPIPGRPATPTNPEIPSSAAPLASAPTTTLSAVAPKAELVKTGISLEPTIELAQKKRYLDFLNQLRRENEGGDTADAPGYQLNLLRIPVSVLPGKHTDKGHGAEVTFTIDPVIGDDLLPTTFRRMTVNDVVEQLGLPLTDVLYDTDQMQLLTNKVQEFLHILTRLDDLDPADLDTASADRASRQQRLFARSLSQQQVKLFKELAGPEANRALGQLRGEVDVAVGLVVGGVAALVPTLDLDPTCTHGKPKTPVRLDRGKFGLKNLMPSDLRQGAAPGPLDHKGPKSPGQMPDVAGAAFRFGKTSNLPFTTGQDSRLPFPISHFNDVYGDVFMFEIAFAIKNSVFNDMQYTGYAHLPDVQSVLRVETQAAYQFLAKNPDLLQNFATGKLVKAIRSRDVREVTRERRRYRACVGNITGSIPKNPNPEKPGDYKNLLNTQFGLTAALAWCLIVDSALLTDKLLTDLRESATAQGKAPMCPVDAWPQFFLPEPPADARQAFADYVRMRWPIHVFALDPMTQEQNLYDSLQTHREMQLALSVAFTSGRIGSRLFTQYSRRLQAQYDTIALNHTQVGFAHGDNTFGWRFYPRFQTPPTQSNLTTLVRDQLIGGPTPDALLRQRRLEPGPRECVALVIMPSFVPYVTVDAVSNWFSLANPKHKTLDHSQAIRLSRTVRSLERCQPTVADADCYRNGEWQRLQTRVKQLGDRLPTQTMAVPVPIVNTTGGFEMFSNGTTDLAPQLYGFYGAPGVAPDQETTLFLVGDHFSSLQTKVIVGNKEIIPEKRKMLSRQVIQVTVPQGAISVTSPDDGTKWVHAHVATPYGVSREVYIPLAAKPAAPAAKSGYSLPDGATLTVRYGVDGRNQLPGWFLPQFQGVKESELKLTWVDSLGLAPERVKVSFEFTYGTSKITVPCVCKGKVIAGLNGRKEAILDADALKSVGCELLRQIRHVGSLPVGSNPLAAGLVADKVVVTPEAPAGQTATSVEANGQLKVVFEEQGLCPPDPKDDCPCPPPAKVPKIVEEKCPCPMPPPGGSTTPSSGEPGSQSGK